MNNFEIMENRFSIPEGDESGDWIVWNKRYFVDELYAILHIKQFRYHFAYKDGSYNTGNIVYKCVMHEKCKNVCKVIRQRNSRWWLIYSKFAHSTTPSDYVSRQIEPYIIHFALPMLLNGAKPKQVIKALRQELTTTFNTYVLRDEGVLRRQLTQLKYREKNKHTKQYVQNNIDIFLRSNACNNVEEFHAYDEKKIMVLRNFGSDQIVFSSKLLITTVPGESTMCVFITM